MSEEPADHPMALEKRCERRVYDSQKPHIMTPIQQARKFLELKQQGLTNLAAAKRVCILAGHSTSKSAIGHHIRKFRIILRNYSADMVDGIIEKYGDLETFTEDYVNVAKDAMQATRFERVGPEDWDERADHTIRLRGAESIRKPIEEDRRANLKAEDLQVRREEVNRSSHGVQHYTYAPVNIIQQRFDSPADNRDAEATLITEADGVLPDGCVIRDAGGPTGDREDDNAGDDSV